MKKVFIACFFAIIMALVPITTVAQTPDVENISQTTLEKPQIFITGGQFWALNIYIEANFEGEAYDQAITIRDEIITDLDVDLVKLADAWEEHGYQPIPQEELTSASNVDELNALIQTYWFGNIFGNLITKIIDLIKDRLGWIYDLFNDGFSLFFRGLDLIFEFISISFVLLIAFVGAVNWVLSIPGAISQALKNLFSFDFGAFIDIMIGLTTTFADWLVALLDGLIYLFGEIQILQNYLIDTRDYIEWLDNEPWEDPILVSGTVRLNFLRLPGATVICRGQNTTTDDYGRFSFSVDPAPSSDSFPPNEYYGMHNCQITVEKNGKVLKQTPKILSYVFSAGKIDWSFFVLKGKSAAASSSSSTSSSSTSSSASSSSSSSSPMLNTYNTQGTNTYSSPNYFQNS